ncbi:hypothetical protein JCM19235_4967 [Vibrio maritimus]|uniref:Uncharacterized protein n=1 Tax=Vibrio maritimus TaxID=990268 RepID=A0A090S1B7_9VIBR|nr:hypothetical protein JCM19235_4967 [Vibrio maritimus]
MLTFSLFARQAFVLQADNSFDFPQHTQQIPENLTFIAITYTL